MKENKMKINNISNQNFKAARIYTYTKKEDFVNNYFNAIELAKKNNTDAVLIPLNENTFALLTGIEARLIKNVKNAAPNYKTAELTLQLLLDAQHCDHDSSIIDFTA